MANTNKSLYGEKWKNVLFGFEFTNDNRLEVSNYGRIRSFNKLSDGNVLKGSLTEGYKIIRLKLFKPTEPEFAKKLLIMQKKIAVQRKQIKFLKENFALKSFIIEEEKELTTKQKELSKALAENTKKRTINYHSLVHRLVATYFLPKPSSERKMVAHLDFDKLNNDEKNLKWMTQQESNVHQQLSPYVIENKNKMRNGKNSNPKIKLTVTKVMLLKKLLNEGKTIKQMVKQFKVSDMQIIRIRRGENWGSIPAAK